MLRFGDSRLRLISAHDCHATFVLSHGRSGNFSESTTRHVRSLLIVTMADSDLQTSAFADTAQTQSSKDGKCQVIAWQSSLKFVY
jgi:hypothetical protein